jgi:hypothetical protein
MKISPAQVTEARPLLGWTQERLSIEARVPPTAVSTFDGDTRTGAKIETALCTALEAGGIEFTEGRPPGAKLLKELK